MVCVTGLDLLSCDVKFFPENSGKIKYYNLCNAPCFPALGCCYLQYFFSFSTKSLTAVWNHCKGWLSSRNFFQWGQNLLLCKSQLLCYCFQAKFQGGAKVFRGANCLRGAPPAPTVEESQKVIKWVIIASLNCLRGTQRHHSLSRSHWQRC